MKACGRGLPDIGFHSRVLGKALLIAALCFTSLYIASYTATLVVLRMNGEGAGLALSAVDPKTGMTGGALFALWLLLANLVNSAMEEGLFRGAMLRHFRIKYSAWGAILLQAGFFAVWHLNWPARMLIDGESIGRVLSEAVGLLIATGISGVVYGYLYLKTDNLWGAFLAHTINNSLFNVLFIRTAAGPQSGLEFGTFIGVFLIGYLLLIPAIALLARRLQMPEVTAWE